jgi:hypothetical protein
MKEESRLMTDVTEARHSSISAPGSERLFIAMRQTRLAVRLAPAVLVAVLAVAGCSSDAVKPNPTSGDFGGLGGGSPGDAPTTRVGGDGSSIVFGVSKGSRDKDQSAAGIGVNAFLWRGALDTIAFMPLASADPFGGVIITDWYTPPGTSGERFKATVYILSRDLRSDGVRVNIYRQVLQNGQWVDAPVADSTIGDIENKVLERARHMREQLQASG